MELNRPALNRRGWQIGLTAVAVMTLVGGGLAIRAASAGHPAVAIPQCLASVGTTLPAGTTLPGTTVPAGTTGYRLDLEQAANASTISGVGKRLGLADHAVTIALAAALQESRLRNLDHGDRDSLGLFQQRPSQGWGTAGQIMRPRYAATAFYQRLAAITGWDTLAVTDAAQRVQRSAAPDAYAQWEAEARVLAQALTGEVPAGLTCRFALSGRSAGPGSWPAELAADVGPNGVGAPVTAAWGWTVAGWLVGHAARYRITAVSFAGRRWTPAGAWVPDPTAGSRVNVATLAPGA